MLWHEARSGVALLSAALAMAAGCTLIGGTDGLFIVDGSGAGGAGATGGSGGSGSSGSSSSSSSSSGTAGAGGSADCDPQQCTGPDGQCATLNCVNTECQSLAVDPGTPCTANGGTVCNGLGDCVECVAEVPASCVAPKTCQNNICVGSSCTDGQKNGDETSTDCGGSCGGCPVGQACNIAGDCLSGYCNANHECEGCTNKDQCLAGMYCAGSVCKPQKSGGQLCSNEDQCLSGVCFVVCIGP